MSILPLILASQLAFAAETAPSKCPPNAPVSYLKSEMLRDLGTALDNTRTVPNIVPNSGGKVAGFKFVEVGKGGLYDQMGLRVGDIWQAYDGKPVNSPTEAMGFYSSLKQNRKTCLTVLRSGKRIFIQVSARQ